MTPKTGVGAVAGNEHGRRDLVAALRQVDAPSSVVIRPLQDVAPTIELRSATAAQARRRHSRAP
jgi:hypothetical protein